MGSAHIRGDKKLNVFVSYSHSDKKWLERLQVHLKPLARDGKVDLWDDTGIKAGQRWHDEIKAALARADVAVVPISADFYASDFIANSELPPLLKANRERGLTVLGVHIGRSDFANDKFLSELQTVNPPDKPVESLTRRDQREQVFQDLARRIGDLVRSAAPEIPPEYLEWLKARYASVELLGQDVQQSLGIKLSHVYVPALIRFTQIEAGPPGATQITEGSAGAPPGVDRQGFAVRFRAGRGRQIHLLPLGGSAEPPRCRNVGFRRNTRSQRRNRCGLGYRCWSPPAVLDGDAVRAGATHLATS
jgi:hypothetical protein